MSDFTFTSLAECDRCGAPLSSSDEDCDSCAGIPTRRYHFERVLSRDDRLITVMSINPIRAWHDMLGDVDEPLGWRCIETGDMGFDSPVDVIDIHES